MGLMLAEVALLCTKSDVDFSEISLFGIVLPHRVQLSVRQTNQLTRNQLLLA
jgi:hypothetical protein